MYDFKSIYEAHTVEDAVAALQKQPRSVIIASGTDILLKIREGKLAGCELVSIGSIKALRGIRLDDAQSIHIGPLTRFREIEHDPIINERIPLLARTVKSIGSPQVRAVATIGGNISNGMTTADSPPALFSYNAVMVITGPGGQRELPIEEYYLAPETLDLKTGELLTDIVIRREDYEGFSGHYIKYAVRNAMDVSLLGCCVNVRLSADGTKLEDIRLSYGAAGPLPLRARKTEDALRGRLLEPALLEDIGKLAPTQDVSPITDRRASRDFRLHLIGLLAQDALTAAVERAGGIIHA